VQTTRFRIWLESKAKPVWTGVKLVRPPEYITADALDVTVEGDGSDLERLIAERQDIFAAYLQFKPEVALPHARQTHRLADIVRLIGFVVGGLPGSRLLARLAITTSDDTVLRRVKMRAPSDSTDNPIRSLGVDDWAWRKGQDYGTILVDLERHRVADLLPGRSAEELADWLTQHPTVNVISRDRSGLYAEGAQGERPSPHRSPIVFTSC
jgi:hypothetical protein